ncbi:capsule assembly Wzi family protein [Siphonobacter sp. SORGH_AS_1065]|uniref:capsule assembly Wzi family protein n=1 Tax=Siphonobacter sp. SORGH_AS_1065 TaxID=3041795 RepID=UPI002781DF7C|nr:capsule assembly Wzi family protein [Siphonobacter sp. SORGH_AS_1065]MDQ1085598.1 hypothetical protein [Siphonobacter sp. SORGH_AS_1065]
MHFFIRRYVWYGFILLAGKIQAQDSLFVSLASVGSLASCSYQPLWAISNQYGVFSDNQVDVSSYIDIRSQHLLKTNKDKSKAFTLKYGLRSFLNEHFKHAFFEEAYVKASYNHLQLRGGWYQDYSGELTRNLSSGSLGISSNARPMPKISMALTDYVEVPFTRGLLEFKGQISHGWFGSDQYMKHSWLHEKMLYVRLKLKNIKFYGGVQHFAQWGGERGSIALKRSMGGFWDVFWVREANDGSVNPGILPNRPGDQRGLLEGGMDWEMDRVSLHAYYQVPFESGTGISIKNRDNLSGLQVSFKDKDSFWQMLVGEFIYTRQMESFGKEQQSYYDNGYYKTGWEYLNRIIGTPLFINRQRGTHYFKEIVPFNWDGPEQTIFGNSNMINNRIIGFHIAALSRITKKITCRTKLTYTQNYGSYAHAYLFNPPKLQVYGSQQVNVLNVTKKWDLFARLSFDWGDLTRNMGLMVGFEKVLVGSPKHFLINR